MNVAFPAVFLFLVVLPGFLFRQFFQRNEVRTFDHTPFSSAVLKALLCAACFNAVVALGVHAFGYEIELGDVIRLLVGGASALSELNGRLAWLNAHPEAGAGYFALTSAVALAAAMVWRAAVQGWELDREGNPFARFVRGDAPWYYLFSGLDHPHPKEDAIDGATVAAVVEFKEGSYLYTGVLDSYEVNADGQLDRLFLVQAQRRELGRDREYDAQNDKYVEDKTRFYPIAGDVFVLGYEEIKTLNVSYFSLG
ncbi:DUF6338 family protein [Paraburkholderia youngii]|uniref:Uncharacterized protein n=2 Tax=Paraburkholderia TaxID=1822464 RepID=A0A7W8LGA2_9BURK|nr:DUF6338 family protein [Paraburkholderia youngii]MBB5405069.1 hypothetical protein [Paraburkholderia youngii]